jgi:hypothetical protein
VYAEIGKRRRKGYSAGIFLITNLCVVLFLPPHRIEVVAQRPLTKAFG